MGLNNVKKTADFGDDATPYARAFRTHLKLHSGEKQNKWNQCDFPSFGADGLRTHLKTHWRKLEPEQPMNSCNLFVFFLHKI